MQYTEFVEQCRKIVATHDEAIAARGFESKSFRLGTGGEPVNSVGLTYQHQSKEYRYGTSMNGDAYSSETVVLCKEIGTDKMGHTIYKTADEICFVWHETEGDPSSFDWGRFAPPEIL